MTKATIAGLVAFINAQPNGRILNHNSGWSACAVGHYCKEELHVAPWLYGNAGPIHGLFQEAGTSDSGVSVAYGYPLTREMTIMDYLRSYVTGKGTYGQLRTALAEHFPKLGVFNKPSNFERFKDWVAELVGA